MRRVIRELLRIAKEVVLRKTLTLHRSPKVENSKLNNIHFEVQRFVDRVRENENMESFVNRSDTDEEMVLEVGLSEHEEVEAIVREILEIASGLANKNKIEMKSK